MRLGSTEVDMVTYRLRESQKGMDFTDHEKDIGVVTDNRLSFEKHTSEKVKVVIITDLGQRQNSA